MSAILPNELIWVDGEFWEWKSDDSCVGLFCQRHDCRPWLAKYFEAQERAFDRYLSEKKQESFLEKLSPGETSMTRIDADIARRKERRRPPFREWVCALPKTVEDVNFLEVPQKPWWMTVRNLTVEDRQNLEERVMSLRLNRGEELGFDLYISEEIERGDWD